MNVRSSDEYKLKLLFGFPVLLHVEYFTYIICCSVYSVWMKFDSRSVPLKINDLNEISMKICRTLQNSRNGYPKVCKSCFILLSGLYTC